MDQETPPSGHLWLVFGICCLVIAVPAMALDLYGLGLSICRKALK